MRLGSSTRSTTTEESMARYFLCATLIACVPSVALAVPTINVGTRGPYTQAIASVPLDISVTGLDATTDAQGKHPNSISAIDLLVSIASESTVAPPGEPKIVGVDVVTGTIFAGNSANPAPGQDFTAVRDLVSKTINSGR